VFSKLNLIAQIFLRSCCDAKSHEAVDEDCIIVQPFLTAVIDFTFQVTLPEYLRVLPKYKDGNIVSDTVSEREKAGGDQDEKRIQNSSLEILDMKGK
jgi:hypothetical protein